MFLISVPLISAQPDEFNTVPSETLAETINTVLNGVQEQNSSWNVIYDQIFCRQDTSVYDNVIAEALSRQDYKEVIFIARLAELNNYTSQILNESLKTALEHMPMAGSFPITYTDEDFPDSFSVYDRYMLNAYRYAQTFNMTRWDINAAYNDFVKAYNTPHVGSVNGEMLWINPKLNYAYSFLSRYYDEHAQTLSMFLLFDQNGANVSTFYIEDVWLNTQAHWNGSIYGYSGKSGVVECEMGNFAMILTQYQNSQGEIPYFDRVVVDLENKLLINQFNSPGWGDEGVIKHADGNPQNRLYETMGNLLALQMLYPQFTQDSQTNFRSMLTSSWKGLINSNLYNNYRFSFMNTSTEVADIYSDEASLLGAMILFLYGIIPQTGSLDIPAIEEKYQDYRTCFQTEQWRFNYSDRSIRIPILKGDLSFIFGLQEVLQNFSADGVYDIYFSSDWNSIVSIDLVDSSLDLVNTGSSGQVTCVLCVVFVLILVVTISLIIVFSYFRGKSKIKWV
ncbi:MAG: hypothetical protein FWH37_06510 [Candidatus Bathyarchaeota archaeon]|nr:hypothetical protein [Candidatus Termiticorpusculum sp.]